jgi:hypothetical protein
MLFFFYKMNTIFSQRAITYIPGMNENDDDEEEGKYRTNDFLSISSVCESNQVYSHSAVVAYSLKRNDE